MRIFEERKRTVAKAVFYRFLLIVSDAVVVFFLTHRWDLTLASVGLISLANTIIYYFYDRFWTNVSWGLVNKK